MQNTEMPVGSPEKKSGKLIWPRYKLKWQIKLAQGVANNFGHIPPKVENYHGPRQMHLIYTGEYARKSDYYWLTAVQLGMVALLSTTTALITGKQVLVWYPHLLSTLLICSLIATVFAFLVQTSMQRYISHTNTALIFCTEPVFAAFYAWLVIDEQLGLAGLLGALLILAGMVVSILPSPARSGKEPSIQGAISLDEYRVGE